MNKFDRIIKDLEDTNNSYHFEYTNIHNQRIALVRLIHLWHQIGFPASLIVFGFFLKNGKATSDSFLIVLGTIFSIAIVWFVRLYTILDLDRGIVNLYPRLITLEIILDYHFYRNYLRKKGEPEEKFIKNCENFEGANTTSDLWKGIDDIFTHKDFPTKKRGHHWLNVAAFVITIGFLSIGTITICNLN